MIYFKLIIQNKTCQRNASLASDGPGVLGLKYQEGHESTTMSILEL